MAGIDISKLRNAVFDDEKVEKKKENRKTIYVSSKEELDRIMKPREIEINNLMKKGEEANKKFVASLNSGEKEAAYYWLGKVGEITDKLANMISENLKTEVKLRR